MNDVIHGDAMSQLQDMDEDSVDFLFTDPPYRITNLKLDKRQFRLEAFLPEFERVLKPDGWFFCFGSAEMFSVLHSEFRYRFQYVWVKQAAAPSHGSAVMPMHQHENIWTFCSKDLDRMSDLYFDKEELRTTGKPYIRPVRKTTTEFGKAAGLPGTDKTSLNPGYRDGTTILYYPNKVHFPIGEATEHPTQKPLAMCQMLCKTYCKPGGLVYDPFMGSGTIPLSAMMTGRRYIGVEIVKEYYAMAKARFDGRLVNFMGAA